MISPLQATLMRRTLEIINGGREHYGATDGLKPFATMLLEDGTRMEVNAATFVRLAITCLREIATASDLNSASPVAP